MLVRIAIDSNAVDVYTDEPGKHSLHKTHKQELDDDLHIVSYFHNCLTDGGRMTERQHALHGKPAAPWIRLFGSRLWKRFPEEVRGYLNPITPGPKRICLEIRVDAADPVGRILHHTPWDLAYFPDYDPMPFGMSDRYALSRLIPVLPPVTPDFAPIGKKLRVLLVRARHNPVAEHDLIYADIRKWPSIELEEWTPQDVQDCIERQGRHSELRNKRFDIIQFVAHGTEENGKWGLDLADSVLLSPTDLKTFTSRRCRVVVLAACSSGEAAREILLGGILGVVAMLYHIGSGTLRRFNDLFYENLIDGQLPVDVAVQAARQELSVAYTPDCAAPQLYVRTPEPIELRLDPSRENQPTSDRPVLPEKSDRRPDGDDRVTAAPAESPKAPPREEAPESITTTLLGWRVKRDG